jgi:hypothetical protein
MAFVFPEEVIDLLARCRYDPAATPIYELLSGSLSWSDENYLEIAMFCRSMGCHACAALFAYRTSLIEGVPREKFRFAWDEVRLRCPEWIGFRPERMTADKALQDFLRWQQEHDF